MVVRACLAKEVLESEKSRAIIIDINYIAYVALAIWNWCLDFNWARYISMQ
jgi:hypothetical protein